MKKLIPILLVLAACNDSQPEPPRELNIEEIGISGGTILPDAGEEISLFISLQYLPKETKNWDLVWLVNDNEISRIDLGNSAKSRTEFARFTPVDPGEYHFQGCIEFERNLICKDRTFTVQ